MPKTIRNEFDKQLTYEKLMIAHKLSRKGKGYRKDVILFNLKQEEYIMWLYEQLKNRTYRHSGYTSFYVTEPKLRRIEKSTYIDRIVHRWYVDNFMQEHFVKSFSYSSFACLKGKGMHNACLYVQEMMKHCKRIWNNYYVIKMDVAKYFQNIDKQILYEILCRKIKDKDLLWLTREILYSNGIDNSEVIFTMQKPKCVGNSTTVSQDINDLEKIEEVLLALTEHTTYRLRKMKMLCNVVSVQLRTSEFKNYSHQRKLDFSTSSTKEIFNVAKQLTKQMYNGESVRLIGIRVDNLCEENEKQISIFENNNIKKQEKLDKVVDLIKDKYGYETITRAGDMKHTKNINRKE